jgi:hypothetical protein
VIAKVPYLSLGSQRVQIKGKASQDWYEWEALKRLIQAAGRISRAPDDFGITYIFDTNFGNLLRTDARRETSLIPVFFKEALVEVPRGTSILGGIF